MVTRTSAWTLCPMIAGALIALDGRAQPAAAHPHVWIDAVATFVFEERVLVGLRQHWKFDEFFSSFVIEEHDDGDGILDDSEIESVRENAFSNLREYGYFTHVRLAGEDLRLDKVSAFTARIEDGVLVYEFSLPLPKPVDPSVESFAAGVYDPEYYVELLLDEYDPVRFEGLPSGACSFAVAEDSEHPIYYGMVYPPLITLSCATS